MGFRIGDALGQREIPLPRRLSHAVNLLENPLYHPLLFSSTLICVSTSRIRTLGGDHGSSRFSASDGVTIARGSHGVSVQQVPSK